MGILSGAMAGLGGGLADIGSMHIKKEAELDYQREIMALREQADVRADERRQRIKREDDQYAFNQEVARAPKKLEIEAAKEKHLGKIKSDQRVEERDTDRQHDVDFFGKNRAAILDKERSLAQARDRDTGERAIRKEAAQLQLDEAKEAKRGRDQVRSLQGAADNVDMSQPGAEDSRRFYEEEAERAAQNNRIASGERRNKPQMKVADDNEGNKYIAVDDGKGGFYRLDPKTLPKYGSKAGTPTKDEFVVGKKYKDGNGKTATYLGNGKWKED